MFRNSLKNNTPPIFSLENNVPDKVAMALKKTWDPFFYQNITLKIDEETFRPLYCKDNGRPNAPVRQMVSMEIIKEMLNLSDEQLFDGAAFDLRIKRAIGLESLEENAPSPRTLYYFRQMVNKHEEETSINLIQKQFEIIRDSMLELTKITGKTQRIDTFHISSNIKKLSRNKIFHKTIKNFLRALDSLQKLGFSIGPPWTEIREFVKEDEDKALYDIKPDRYSKMLEKYAAFAYELLEFYKNEIIINQMEEYKTLSRVLGDQAIVCEDRIEIKPSKEILPTSVQNPADVEAIYNKKNTVENRGYKASVTETCDENNKVQLITNTDLYDNNKDDGIILEKEIKATKEIGGLEEIISDGGFPTEGSEKACSEAHVKLIGTEIKGRKVESSITTADFKMDENNKILECPGKCIPIKQVKNEKRIIAHFAKKDCRDCPLRNDCMVRERKKSYSLRVSLRRCVLDKRRKNYNSDEYQRAQKLRPPVEGAVSQLKPKYLNGRSMFRGKKKIKCRLFLKAIGANFRRIWLYFEDMLKNFIRHVVLIQFIDRLRLVSR